VINKALAHTDTHRLFTGEPQLACLPRLLALILKENLGR